MTLEEACRLIDPATDIDALAEIEYYNGFKGSPASRSPPPTAPSVRWRWVMPPTARSRKVSDGGLHDGENVQTAQGRPAPC